jgi:hypothetical protein
MWQNEWTRPTHLLDMKEYLHWKPACRKAYAQAKSVIGLRNSCWRRSNSRESLLAEPFWTGQVDN